MALFKTKPGCPCSKSQDEALDDTDYMKSESSSSPPCAHPFWWGVRGIVYLWQLHNPPSKPYKQDELQTNAETCEYWYIKVQNNNTIADKRRNINTHAFDFIASVSSMLGHVWG